MKKTREYLENRIKALTEERNGYAVSYNKNQIVIVETDKAIRKIENSSDEAMEIFSPKARENNSFNKQEVRELETKIVTISQVNLDLHNKIKKIDSEISQINECLSEIEKGKSKNKKESTNVSRETFGEKEKFIEKLKNINSLIFSNQYEADVELKKIIKELM